MVPPAGSTSKPFTSTAPDSKAPGQSSAGPVKTESKTDPFKPDSAKVELGKVESGKVEPAKPAAASFGAGKTASLQPDASKPEAPKPGAFGGHPQSHSSKGDVTDGPIIDLKAKRLPDPAEAPGAAKAPGASPAGSATAPGTVKPVSDAKGSSETKGPSDVKPSGSTTPRIAPAEPASRGPGFGAMAAAGLIGGVLGAGLLFAVEKSGILVEADDARFAALDQRIAALAPKDALTALDKRIGANETALKPLPAALLAAETTAKKALEKAGAAPALTQTEGSPAGVTTPPDLIARLDGLDQRVAALQEEPGRDQSGNAGLTAISPQLISGLEDRLKNVEGKVDGVAKADTSGSLAAQLASLKGDLETRTKATTAAEEALNQKLASLQQALDARVKAATEAVQAATQASQQATDAGKLQAAEAAKGVERQIQAQAEKIAGLDQAVASRADAGALQAAMRIVSADRIVGALGTGVPYDAALSALRNAEPGDPARLSAVAAFADKGAPTARSLAGEFRPIAEKIAASRRAAQAKSVAETGDIKQRLMSMAESIVQVRKVDAPTPAGEISTEDGLTKVQDALDRGAIGEAAKAFAALPEDARAQAGEFGTKLSSRAAAGEAAQALLADAFKALPATSATR